MCGLVISYLDLLRIGGQGINGQDFYVMCGLVMSYLHLLLIGGQGIGQDVAGEWMAKISILV